MINPTDVSKGFGATTRREGQHDLLPRQALRTDRAKWGGKSTYAHPNGRRVSRLRRISLPDRSGSCARTSTPSAHSVMDTVIQGNARLWTVGKARSSTPG